MIQKRAGNVRQNPEPEPRVFEEGDVVALTPEALRMGKLKRMTCRNLHEHGWSNEFPVRKVFETEEDGQCITLWPCCLNMRDWKTGQFRCTGHPSIYFKKVSFVRTPKKGDRRSSLILPVIGELFGFEYQDDEDNPQFAARILGHGPVVDGEFAKILKKIVEEANLI